MDFGQIGVRNEVCSSIEHAVNDAGNSTDYIGNVHHKLLVFVITQPTSTTNVVSSRVSQTCFIS